MKIIKSPQQMQSVCLALKKKGRAIGFVPTMGALHQGHLSLIRKARKENDIVAVSIFVNPRQFGPHEDLKKYPRPRVLDLALCKKSGVDLVFNPEVSGLYPQNFKTNVYLEGLSQLLCGASRPEHFRGVTTIVAKLFNIVQPDSAYFGQKDGQQTVIIKRMAEDLNFPVKIKVLPTLREKDGLAMSSRNIYLNKIQRQDALALNKALGLARLLIACGQKDSAKIMAKMRGLIEKKKSAKIDYLAAVDMNNLKPVKRVTRNCLIALAVKIGKARLIDNIII